MLSEIREFLKTHVKDTGNDFLYDDDDWYGKYTHWQSSRTDGGLKTYIIRFYPDKRSDGTYLVRRQINRDILHIGTPHMEFCSSVEDFKQIFERFLQID